MGTVFTLVEIGLKPILGLTDPQFGIVAGGSLHEIAHAVAAGGAFGEASLDNALIMKLSRVLLLAPVSLPVFWEHFCHFLLDSLMVLFKQLTSF